MIRALNASPASVDTATCGSPRRPKASASREEGDPSFESESFGVSSCRLLLLRHAHAGHPPGTRDYDRPLSAAGEEAAIAMGTYMARENLLPALALVSGSQRTRTTWACLQKALPSLVPAIFENRIYEAHASVLLDVLRGVSPGSSTLLLVGHNPGVHDLALQLVGRSGRTAYGRLRQGFQPASLAVIDFEMAGWDSIAEHAGALERFASPDTGDDD